MCKCTSEESSDFVTVLEITECHFWYVLLAKAVRNEHLPRDGGKSQGYSIENYIR